MMAASSSMTASTTTVASQRSNTSVKSLQEDRKLAYRLLMDFLILVLIIIPIPICEFSIQPFRRGFFCNDDTIRYPHHGNTVTALMLGLLVGLIPMVAFVAVELLRFYRRGQMNDAMFLCGLKAPTWLMMCGQQMMYYIVGLLLTFDATEVGKYAIGRLRPHFMAVCQPRLLDGTTCADPQNQHRYIEDYVCEAKGFTPVDVLEIRRSFPSGHSSLAFYAMIYVAIYLQHRLTIRSSRLARNFLQFAAVMLAWFTALSRVMDNWHHWSDVLAGTLIGIGCAVIATRCIAKLQRRNNQTNTNTNTNNNNNHNNNNSHHHHQRDSSTDNLKIGIPRQDTSATLDEVITTTPPPYVLETSNSFSNEQYCTKV